MPKPPSIFIIPFRFYKGHIEILLKTHAKKLEQNYISDISGPLHNDDPSPIFAAARIFLTDFLKMNYKLDEKVLKISKHFIFFIKRILIGTLMNSENGLEKYVQLLSITNLTPVTFTSLKITASSAITTAELTRTTTFHGIV